MPGKISIDDLLPETKKKLKLQSQLVPSKVIVLGKLLQDIQGLTTREALWALRTASDYARGYRKKKSKAYSNQKGD